MGWLTGWTYRKSVTISRASGAVTNYQMKLLVGESSGASGEDVDCGGHCLSSFNDLRFTASDGVTLLDYWIESISGTTPNQLATVWIEFDSIGTSATTFYMYYGNSSASAASNGANTFIFFDDFERGLDGDTVGGSWTEVTPHVHISTNVGGYTGSRSAKIVQAVGTQANATVPLTAASMSYAIQCHYYKRTSAILGMFTHGNGTNRLLVRIDASEDIQYYSSSGTWTTTSHSGTAGVWEKIEVANIDFSAGTFDIYHDDTLILSGATMHANANQQNIIRMANDASMAVNDDSWVDLFIVRNWRSTGPAWGTWGSEENASSTTYNESIEESLVLTDELRYFTEEIIESLVLTDRFSHDEAVILDTIDFFEAFYTLIDVEISESVDLVDEDLHATLYSPELNESVDLTDTNIASWAKSLLDGLFIYDTPLPSWAKTIAESIDLADLAKPLLGVPVIDWLWLIDSQINNWDGVEQINQPLNLYDLPRGTKIVNRSIAETIALSDAVSLQFLVGILEYMRFTDLVAAIGTFNHTAADAIRLTDLASKSFDKLIAETLTVVDASAVLTTFMPSLAESIGIADSSSNGLTANKVITDSLALTDVSGSGLHAFAIIQDGLALNVIIELDGETYQCYVLNTPKFMPSVYSGFDFNSYCTFQGKTYGANATGIYELAGGTDAGTVIQTGVVMPQTTFGIPDSKKLRRAWLGITGTSPALVLEVEDGTRKAYAIDSYGEVGSDREISGKKWKLSIANFDELDFIRILPVALVR